MSNSPFDDLKDRGFVYQITAEEAVKELLLKEKVYFYVGFDPTGSSLHVGHLLPVMAMRRLQAAGGDITIIRRDYYGHHPHGLDDPRPLADFILQYYPAPLKRKCRHAKFGKIRR